MGFDLAAALTTFALILPVELPDKTFVAALVLATRYPGLGVWVGVSAAFGVQVLIAVTAGEAVSLLPRPIVLAAATVLFLAGAAVLLRTAGHADQEVAEEEREIRRRLGRRASGMRIAATSFAVVFLAEWGDLSQLLTAGLVVRYREPVSVFAGSWLALAAVAALAVVAGRALVRRLSLPTIRPIG